MRALFILFVVTLVITGAKSAGNGEGHSEFLQAFARNDIDGLKSLAQRCMTGASADKQLGMLALAGARFRSDDMLGCLRILDSLQATAPIADNRVGAMAYQIRAQVMDWAGKPEEGARLIDKGLHLADSTTAPIERATLHIIGAEIRLSEGDLREAMEHLLHAERLAHRIGFTRGLAMVRINQGTIRFHQDRYEEAATYFEETVRLAADNEWAVLLDNAAFNLASTLIMLSRPTEALQVFESLLQRQSLAPGMRAQLLSHIGRIKQDTGDHGQAMRSFQRSIAISDSLHDIRESLKTRQQLAYAEWSMGDHSKAITSLEVLVAEARELRMLSATTEMLWQLHDWYGQIGLPERSLEVMRQYSNLSDSLCKLEFNEQIARAEVNFETERKERQIAEQAQALALAATEDRRKNIQRIALGISALAVTIIALLLARSLRNRRRLADQERELHAQRVDELLKRNEIDALNAMMEGQEKERDRVARDLHDRLGSMLSAIKHQIDGLDADIQDIQAEQRGNYTKVNRMLDEAVGEVRRISHDMVSITLARFGLEKALEDLCDSVRLNGKLAVELSLFGLEQRMDRGLEITIYRMVQELVSNVLKHAGAHELSIAVTRGPGRISVIVSDDGRGFDTTAAVDGIGLSNVRARAAAMGAQVTVNSTPTTGTTVSIEGPVVE